MTSGAFAYVAVLWLNFNLRTWFAALQSNKKQVKSPQLDALT